MFPRLRPGACVALLSSWSLVFLMMVFGEFPGPGPNPLCASSIFNLRGPPLFSSVGARHPARLFFRPELGSEKVLVHSEHPSSLRPSLPHPATSSFLRLFSCPVPGPTAQHVRSFILLAFVASTCHPTNYLLPILLPLTYSSSWEYESFSKEGLSFLPLPPFLTSSPSAWNVLTPVSFKAQFRSHLPHKISPISLLFSPLTRHVILHVLMVS